MNTGAATARALQEESGAKSESGAEAAAKSQTKPGALPVPLSDEESRWRRVAELPCDVAVLLPAPGLRVSDLLGLAPGFVVRTTAPVSADVPLQVNGQVIGWCEFEVVHERLGVRLTELA